MSTKTAAKKKISKAVDAVDEAPKAAKKAKKAKSATSEAPPKEEEVVATEEKTTDSTTTDLTKKKKKKKKVTDELVEKTDESPVVDLAKKKKKKKKKAEKEEEEDTEAQQEVPEESTKEVQKEAEEASETVKKSDEDFDFSLKKKKKKKKKVDVEEDELKEPAEAEAEAAPGTPKPALKSALSKTPSSVQKKVVIKDPRTEEEPTPESSEIRFPAKKKKVKKAVVELEEEEPEEPEEPEEEHDSSKENEDFDDNVAFEPATPAVKPDWSESDRDYEYPELLATIYGLLNQNNPELMKLKNKFVIQPPDVLREGTKKTIWANFQGICDQMHRQTEHVLNYARAELGTSASIDGNHRLVIKGRFQPKQIETVLRHYIAEYVSCRTCRSPETLLKKENRLNFLQCKACGSTRTVAQIKQGFVAITNKRKKAN